MLAACATKRPVVVLLEGSDAIVYRGSISAEANKRIFGMYEKAKVKPRLLRISSDGGDVNLGMDLGDWVFRHQLDVEIIDKCLSSCANYVFPAGKTKFLNPDSILLWHGGALQQNLDEQMKSLGQAGSNYLDAWRCREKTFFDTIGVNQAVTTYGQTAPHIARSQGTVGYDYSIEDMLKFGIANVVEKAGPWRRREVSPDAPSQIVRVEVTLINDSLDERAAQPAAGADR
jgi:hypothetical protein